MQATHQRYRAFYHFLLWSLAAIALVFAGKIDELAKWFNEFFHPMALITPILTGIFLLGIAALLKKNLTVSYFRRVMIEETLGTLYAATAICADIVWYYFSLIVRLDFLIVTLFIAVQSVLYGLLLYVWPKCGSIVLGNESGGPKTTTEV